MGFQAKVFLCTKNVSLEEAKVFLESSCTARLGVVCRIQLVAPKCPKNGKA